MIIRKGKNNLNAEVSEDITNETLITKCGGIVLSRIIQLIAIPGTSKERREDLWQSFTANVLKKGT